MSFIEVFLFCPLLEILLHILSLSASCPLVVCRVLEVIIEEQVEKLQATLRGIETLSVVARHTASKLTELISSEEVCPYSQYMHYHLKSQGF